MYYRECHFLGLCLVTLNFGEFGFLGSQKCGSDMELSDDVMTFAGACLVRYYLSVTAVVFLDVP